MIGIKLTEVEMQYISLFETLTQVEACDCIIDEEYNRVIFVVRRGVAGRAIGSNGANVRMLKKLLGKDVDVVEEGESLEEVIQAALFPAKVIRLEVKEGKNGMKVALVEVPPEQRGLAIGRGGRNIRRAKLLAMRYFNTAVALK